ncbi:MAG: ribosome-associated translation inhibitor RaiA [Proteobacteria bacterium]|nr:ribosome-associated translation inhibitor RaiA [Pseudomonadota bacterium]
MHITVTGKQIEVGEALRGHMESALTAAVSKYFSNPLESQIVFTREAHLFRADVSVHVGRGILVQGQALAADAYGAGDAAVEHVAKRLRRYKRRLRDHHKERERDKVEAVTAQSYVLAAEPDDGDDADAGAGTQPAVVAEMTTEILTLSVGEAVMRLDLGVEPALLFRHAGHGGLNLVYRRSDGNVGWIDPHGNRTTIDSGAAGVAAAKRK